MRKGFQNVFELTAVSGILLSIATVALLTMSNSKGTGFIGEDVLDAYKSKGVVAAFQTAGKETGSAAAKSWEGMKMDASGFWGVVQQTPAYDSAKQACAKIVTVKGPVADSLAEQVEALKKQARFVFSIPADDLDDGHYGPIVPVQLQGTPKVSKKVHLKPSPDEVKRRPRQAALEGKAL